MQTPHVEEREQFEKRLAEVRATGLCPHCHAPFRAEKLVYLSLHAIEFGVKCTGEGRVWKVALPWCPRCERVPETYGCVHVQTLSNSRAWRRPQRCDFCMKPRVPIKKTVIAKSFLEGLMASGETLVDAGEWAACDDCAALIDAGNFAALVETGVEGTLGMHPELRSVPNIRAKLRERVRFIYSGIMGVDVTSEGRRE